jgi:hypothetical protein
VAQIEAYCALVELVVDIKISGWMLHYITRDDPVYGRVTKVGLTDEAKKKEILKRIRGYDRHYELAKSLTGSIIKTLIDEKPCTTQEVYIKDIKAFNPCPLEGVCFHKKNLVDEMRMVWSDYKKL